MGKQFLHYFPFFVVLCVFKCGCALPTDIGSAHDDVTPVLRPLENMADRFLQSETMDVFDDLTARTIQGLSRFVDDAGIAVMTMVDRLPETIDNVADTVDDVVRNADDIGRDVAVIVTAPVRVIEALVPPRVNRQDETPTKSLKENAISRQWEEGTELERGTRSSPPINHDVTDILGDERDDKVAKETVQNDVQGNEKKKNKKDDLRIDSTAIVRRPLSSLLRSIGSHLQRHREAEKKREKNVFERNFQKSKTQQSIQQLEEEIGGFLGRILGTVYRNADSIDESLSQSIRRFVGDRRDQQGSQSGTKSSDTPKQKSVVTSEANPQSITTAKPSTTTEYPFLLSFDDVDPAPVRNSALLLP